MCMFIVTSFIFDRCSYLRDCLAIFQQPSEDQNMEKFKGAITSIEQIIRAHPDDLGTLSCNCEIHRFNYNNRRSQRTISSILDTNKN